MYEEILKHKRTDRKLILDDEKEKVVKLFMPFLRCGKIDQLCEHFIDMILENGGSQSTTMSMEVINTYLMDEECEYYKHLAHK